jgi:hypothetical protein
MGNCALISEKRENQRSLPMLLKYAQLLIWAFFFSISRYRKLGEYFQRFPSFIGK